MSRLAYPIPGAALGDGFGPRDPITTAGGTSGSFHYGQDFAAAAYTPILAAGAGVVIASAWIGTYGYAVYIDHGDGLVTRYAHMVAPPPVVRGQHVAAGERIGFVGSTGASTGPHLHFETLNNGVRVDPMKYLTGNGGLTLSATAEKQIHNTYAGIWKGGKATIDGKVQEFRYGVLPIVAHNQTLIAQLIGQVAALTAAVKALPGGGQVNHAALEAAAEKGARDALADLTLRAE